MSCVAWFCLAQANWSDLSRVEERLADHIGLIGVVYFVIALFGIFADVGLVLYGRNRFLHWSQHVSRLEWRPWNARDILHLVFFLILLHGLFGLFQSRLVDWFEPYLKEESFLVIAESIVFHWVGLLVVALMLWRRRMPWKSAFGFEFRCVPKHVLQGLLFLLATMPVLLFYTALYHVFLQFAGQETPLQDVAFAISDETALAVKIYFAVLAVFIAPLFEEMLFRGIGLPVLAKRFGLAPAIFFIAIIFAVIHGHVPSLVPLFLLSIALSLAYIYTESLLVPIVMHGLFNAITVMLLMGLQ